MKKPIKHKGVKTSLVIIVAVIITPSFVWATNQNQGIAAPTTDSIWLRPSNIKTETPLWGFVDGIRVGLAPIPGPRGLLRIFTPYMGQPDMRLINFIAIEPIPINDTRRGYSELEFSSLDNQPGKRFWSSNDSLALEPLDPTYPARGVIEKINGQETLTVYIFSEPFENGAKVYVRLRFYANRPHEFELTTYAREDSAPIGYCVLSATMGNYARLRNLYLRNTVKRAGDVWPDYKGIHFALHDSTTVNQMICDQDTDTYYFIAAPNEKDPMNVTYDPRTTPNWFYEGIVGTQYWYKQHPDPALMGLVSGRYCYWASEAPIPGGISYENFELLEPFRQGATFVFGIEPEEPEKIIRKIKKGQF